MIKPQQLPITFLTRLLAASRELHRLYHRDPRIPQQLVLNTHLFRYAHYFDTGIKGHNCIWTQMTARGYLADGEQELYLKLANVLDLGVLGDLLSKVQAASPSRLANVQAADLPKQILEGEHSV